MTLANRDRDGAPFAGAVVVAAGRGERFGDSGKVLAPVAGRPMLAWTLDALEAASSIRDVVIVYGAHTEAGIGALVNGGAWTKVCGLVPGGAMRQVSVACGVREVAADLDVVLIHDAARPLATPALFDACASAAREQGAAIAAILVADTLKRVEDGFIQATVSRDGMWAAQTPQGFRLAELRDACLTVERSDVEFTDEAALFEMLGKPVAVVPGDRTNLKVTHSDDVLLVDLLLRHRLEISQRESPG